MALAASVPALLSPAAAASPQPRAAEPPPVTIALLPAGTPLSELASVPGIAPGVMSAGLGSVPARQTYLDIGQGNRIFDSLYEGELPPTRLEGERIEDWGRVVDRADSAPSDIVPGLLASALAPAGAFELGSGLRAPALLAADRAGRLPPRGRADPGFPPAVRVVGAGVADLPRLISTLRRRDLMIAITRPPPAEQRRLAIGIAGAGYRGNLTSDSTRRDGYVLSTDLAPTILERFRIDPPPEMSGEPIRAQGTADVDAVVSLDDRMAEIQPRRGLVIGSTLLIWVLATTIAVAIGRRAAALVALPLLALSVVFVPLLLLAGAALRPSQLAEWILVLLGAPALAGLALTVLAAYRALALACALSILAHAVDVVAGSPLTSLSLIGPNPGLGVRFYGIGNELEAVLAVLVPVGTGAAIAGFFPGLAPRRAAAAFGAVAVAAVLVFAPGRFGADVGAAIILPIGGATAAAVALGARRWTLLAAFASPLLAIGALAAIDLASGGNAHLTRSVLDAGGLHDVAEVAERRLRLSALSFVRLSLLPFLLASVAVLVLGVRHRRELLAWFTEQRIRAGFLGAAAAVAAGTLANDSGALILMIGVAYLLVIAGFAWAEAGNRPRRQV